MVVAASPGLRSASTTLSVVVAALAAVQAVLGLTMSGEYRDTDLLRAGWFGNDVVTLVVAVPVLLGALALARRGSPRARVVWLGMLGYVIYNDAFYLFGAALNTFFPIYVGLLVLAVVALATALVRLDVAATGEAFSPRTPARVVGGYLVVLGSGLGAVWVALWAGHVFAGAALPVDVETFRVVAALDLTVVVPVLLGGGTLLWRRRPWGFVLGAAAGVIGTGYLLVLGASSLTVVVRGLADAPGELPLWGSLAVTTTAATVLLLARPQRRVTSILGSPRTTDGKEPT
jgi:hypothetical protein